MNSELKGSAADAARPFTTANPLTGEIFIERDYRARLTVPIPGNPCENLLNDCAALLRCPLSEQEEKFVTYLVRARLVPRQSAPGGYIVVISDRQLTRLNNLINKYAVLSRSLSRGRCHSSTTSH